MRESQSKTKSYYDNIIDIISDQDNISFKRLSNQREEKVFSNQKIDDNLSPEEFLLEVGKISKSKEILFETAYHDLSKRNPVENRVGDINKPTSRGECLDELNRLEKNFIFEL